MVRKLDRYLALELLGPFGFGVAIFTALFLGVDVLGDLMKMAAQWGLSLGTALRLILCKLPWILGFTFPMSMLLGTLLCFGRLSTDSEIVAMRAGGVSFQRLVAPIFLCALLVSLATILLNETLIPAGLQAERRTLENLSQAAGRPVPDKVFTVRESALRGTRLVVYAETFDLRHKEMSGIRILGFQGNQSFVVQARRAVWRDRDWHLSDGRIWLLEETEERPIFSSHFREKGSLDVRIGDEALALTKTPEEIARDTAEPKELTLRDLRRRVKDLEATGEAPRKIAPFRMEFHYRLAIPFTSLLFAFVGAPLGARPRRTTNSLAFGMSVAIIFLYYILWHALGYWGKAGVLSPLLAAWAPNLIMASLGLYLVWRAGR